MAKRHPRTYFRVDHLSTNLRWIGKQHWLLQFNDVNNKTHIYDKQTSI